jgi:hypothetical protein
MSALADVETAAEPAMASTATAPSNFPVNMVISSVQITLLNKRAQAPAGSVAMNSGGEARSSGVLQQRGERLLGLPNPVWLVRFHLVEIGQLWASRFVEDLLVFEAPEDKCAGCALIERDDRRA